MTPPAAATAAGPHRAAPPGPGGTQPRRRRPARTARARPVRRTPAPRAARRVSGPSAAAAAAPALALRGAAVAAPIGLRVVRGVAALPEHRFLDPLVRGRWWIGLVGFLLIGIVAMQVSLLSLNAGIGRSVERAAALERANGELRGAVSRLAARERVMAEAQRLGLVMPGAGGVRFIAPSARRDIPAAVAALKGGAFAPDAAAASGDGMDATSTDGTTTDGTSTDGTPTDGTSTDGTSTDGSSTDGSSTDMSSSDSGAGDTGTTADTVSGDTAAADSGSGGVAADAGATG
ncbi:MAG: hypothetical protein U0R70_06810 [Solirubrobacteraceae bacterium]